MVDSTIPANLLRRRVYLLHFYDPQTATSQGYKHARHYLGAAEDVSLRLSQHHHGTGARLTQVVIEHGLSFVVARTWRGGRRKEKALKRGHSGVRLCPICGGKITLTEVLAAQPPPVTRAPGRRAPLPNSTSYFS